MPDIITASHPQSPRIDSAHTERNLALGYLRGFVIVLVVAHHAMLAYHPFAPPVRSSLDIPPHWWLAFPVVDPQRSKFVTPFVGFNDNFFMSLMFFLSGLFVWKSLRRKDVGPFLRGRVMRLGIPFAVGALLLAPLAYYPAFLQTRSPGGLAAFWHQWLSLGSWPAGPAWFLWVLFVFDCIAAGLFRFAPKSLEAFGRFAAAVSERPVRLFVLVLAISGVLYVPLALVLNPAQWSVFGPFTFQTTRLLHYLAYFLIGVALGSQPLAQTFLSPTSKLTRRWPLWASSAVLAFLVLSLIAVAALTSHAGSKTWAAFANFAFVVSCAASCFAFLALFLRFFNRRIRAFDSLSSNSYGIYLMHYFCVSWLQYVLLAAPMSGFVKGATVTICALALSWSASAALRRSRSIARVL